MIYHIHFYQQHFIKPLS